uniref:Uncharacterized protein n=1 Tax=Anguilla anguilla TaxID=7936 RepID=A0A0E9S868_ANGAN
MTFSDYTLFRILGIMEKLAQYDMPTFNSH